MAHRDPFHQYQEARDTSNILLILGCIGFVLSIVFLVSGFEHPFRIHALSFWVRSGLGPLTLLPSFVFLPIGWFARRKAIRLRPSPEERR
jgi:hypothetical protein